MDKPIPKEEIKREAMIRYAKAAAVVAAVALVVWGITAVSRPSIKRSDLRMAEAKVTTIETTVSSTGTIVPAFEEIITSPISSRIIEVYSKAGDRLEAGTPIMRLDLDATQADFDGMVDSRDMKQLELEQLRLSNITSNNDLEMRIRVKEMELDRMKVNVQNERYLDSLGSGTGDQVRQAELDYEKTRLELEQLRQQSENERANSEMRYQSKQLELNIAERNLTQQQRMLQDALLRSPRSAVLTSVVDNIGQTVGKGERLATIADLSHFRAQGEIADMHAAKVQPGAGVIIKAGKNIGRGTVTTVTPQSSNGMIKYTVSLNEDSASYLRSGLKADIYVLSNVIDDAVAIPNISQYTGPGVYQLYVLSKDGSELEQHSVNLGAANYDLIEVVSGISPGETVITSDLSKYKTNKTLKLK
ncbi:MAG: HlyD family efflux transporter periplasmic adaptor subunit [Bacteroidales bacterium]|nr:HlyD family efflux transporter periplasmic adaptor subunit [Bacteroidales bacterium]